MSLPECHSRRRLSGEERQYFCAHPQVHVSEQIVTAEICQICRLPFSPPPARFREFVPRHPLLARKGACLYLGEQVGLQDCATCRGRVQLKVYECGHPWHADTTLEKCEKCPHYERRLERGSVRNWAVGVTTAPRPIATLERTLDSLAVAGWDDVRLFAEPESEIPAKYSHLRVSQRDVRLGAFCNWMLALEELVLRESYSDAYMICQDDVILARGLREYLEAGLWPAERLGVVSIYCPEPHARNRGQGFFAQRRGWETWGALVYIFPNAAARRLLIDPMFHRHRMRGPACGEIHIDSVIGLWCREAQLDFYIHEPSLAWHIGDTSAIAAGAPSGGFRQAAKFVEDVSQRQGSLRRPESVAGSVTHDGGNASGV